MNNNNNNNQQTITCGNHDYKQMAGSSNIFCPCCGDIKSPDSQKLKCEREVKPVHTCKPETVIKSGRLDQNYLLATQVSAVVMECVGAFINDKKVCIVPSGKYSFMESDLHRFVECLEKMGYSLSIRQGTLISDKEYVIKLDKSKKGIV